MPFAVQLSKRFKSAGKPDRMVGGGAYLLHAYMENGGAFTTQRGRLRRRWAEGSSRDNSSYCSSDARKGLVHVWDS